MAAQETQSQAPGLSIKIFQMVHEVDAGLVLFLLKLGSMSLSVCACVLFGSGCLIVTILE
eukprot:6201220-Amphidinium_carterae.1